LAGHGGRAVDVGIGGAQGQHDGGHRGDVGAGRAQGVAQQARQRDVGGCLWPEDADRGDRQAQVQRGGDGQSNGYRARQLPGRIREPRGERGDGLPAGEGEHQRGRRAADREPAVRREWRPVTGLRRGRRPGDRHDHHAGQQADEDELGGGAGPQPASGEPDDGQQQRGRDGGAGKLAAAGQLRDVAGADEAHDRGAAYHSGKEHPADHPARAWPQASGDVADHPACGRVAPAQSREHGGEQARKAQQGYPGKDRGGPGLGGGKARQEQQTGAEDRPDVQGGAARGRQVLRYSRLFHACQCHGSTIA
jgi:hypothetical protein